MDVDNVQKVMTEFEKSSVRELKIEDGSFHLYLSKNDRPASQEPVTNTPEVADQPVKHSSKNEPRGAQIKAPLVGTVYLQSKPDQPPYVKVGSHVNKGDVVCVIEAMKMMTEVKSEVAGTVSVINVDNGELVEYQQPLF
ncbi:putative acetyl-CoA carboxylase, biotin carboxyl carrier protein, partial [Limosilactobacillus vaginalis DSM 5837 = ATCC 49540]